MARHMPYRATTSSGNQFEFDFELHPETVQPVHVSNLLTAVLEALDREISILGRVGNGDVLQALAMALAVRTRMLAGGNEDVDAMVRELLATALRSSTVADGSNVDPGSPRDVH
ncbi:MAG: hypothetical protein MK142_09165 [Pseudomonadales bacterium]|nr:hypothetical protein [Pseudomonadales bacterium]MEE2891377.1 hypothetical protein [Pseudomonadota bacterium]